MTAAHFRILATAPASRARTGILSTLHGDVATPVFMPVGTRGSVRTQTLPQLLELRELGAPILLANTYHLLVRPGPELFERIGGLHAWTRWPGAFLTDSGGFQIFSLAQREGSAMHEDGAIFRDRNAPGPILLTPERSIAMQRAIGSDIMMVLDQCIDSTSPHAAARSAMELTHRWAARSLAARADSAQQLFAIVQGACFPDLRRESALALTSLARGATRDFDGFAIGGLAVGESRAEREDTTELVTALLPLDRPRYLMGVGTPVDILEAVHRGVDMFDCILPTAWAQHGKAFTSHGRIDLRRGVHRASDAPLDANCPCPTCTTYARSFLHHLVKAQEPLGWQLLANHNLRFYTRLMSTLRAEIAAGTFATYYAENRARLALDDEDNPPGPRPRSKPARASTRGAFSVVTRGEQSWIAHVASGETMHSVNAPDEEAERVYVNQSALLARALSSTSHDPAQRLVIWDVGLGAAHNAMALIRAVERARDHRRASEPEATMPDIELVSFEHDTDAFRLALAHQKEFPHLRHPAPHILARYGRYDSTSRPGAIDTRASSPLDPRASNPLDTRASGALDVRPTLSWRVVEGDFLSTFPRERAPDIIFFDPFSSKVDTRMWTLDAFRALRAHLDRPCELFTYSASTAIRTSLLLAGFYVARGAPSGPKESTTIAFVFGPSVDRDAAVSIEASHPFAKHRLLDTAWLERRARSSAKFASDVPVEQHADLERRLLAHPQFALGPEATSRDGSTSLRSGEQLGERSVLGGRDRLEHETG
ncbi:MAG: tRNA guanosine(34) transglycosylase Tgt [Kofleriaceae bacterium]